MGHVSDNVKTYIFTWLTYLLQKLNKIRQCTSLSSPSTAENYVRELKSQTLILETTRTDGGQVTDKLHTASSD